MTHKRLILEMGMGNDLHGGDYTKAACRAVQDALHHSSLALFGSLNLDHADMQVRVTIGVQRPDRVDKAQIAEQIPYGTAEVIVELGGLDVPQDDDSKATIVASAGVEAFVDVSEGRFKLENP